ncbi:MAG: efflux RND transporter permease subunit, partial [Bacteroidia bacterium]
TYFGPNDKWRIEGYGAYGFKDNRFKYGISGKWLLDPQNRLIVSAGNRRDVEQTGVSLTVNDNVLGRSFASSALLFFTKGKVKNLKKRNNSWELIMEKLYWFNKTRYRFILLGMVVLLAIASVGIRQISTNAFIKGDIPDRAKLKSDFEYFENVFAGVRAFEMAVMPAKGYIITNDKVLTQIAKLENYLKDSHKVNNIVSPTLPFKMIHNAFTRGKSAYSMPQNVDIRKYASFLKMDTSSNLKSLMNASANLGRISGRQVDYGSDFHESKIAVIQHWVENNIDTDLVNFKVTGTTLMYDKNHEYLRNSLFRSLGLAFIIVGFLFALLFKDYRMVIVSIIPNLIPLILAAGMMGFLNIKLQALTSIFFAISFGIAVDDTIHFLTRFKLERKKGLTVNKSIKNSLLISGKAIIITSIILIVSFISLTFSDFKGTYYIGFLVSITLFTAILSDLFVLPQLLYFINRKGRGNRKKR